jgi:glycosyltransferase involved in cell wall biosynthesis
MIFVIEALGLTAGGGRTGLLKLLPALAARGRDHNFVAVLADLEEFRALERPNLKLILRKKPASLLRRHLHLQRTIPRICAEQRADALLCLGNFGPRSSPVPTVVFLHNARYLWGDPVRRRVTLREKLITRYGKSYLRRLPGGSLLAVQSELMKRRLVEVQRIPASRVVVIPDGDALPSTFARPALTPGIDDNTGSERQLHDGHESRCGNAASDHPFTFLGLARYYPHKNLEVLPEAMKLLSNYTQRPARCLITIGADEHPGARKLLRKLVLERLEQAVVNLGPLDGQEVVKAYLSADALVLPTLLESFGRAYLEAMRFDLPILTSDRDFAREVCRGAAIYFDPLDPDSVARSMARIMSDAGLRDRLAIERRHIPIPSWDDVAARFVEVLERTAALRGSPSAPDPLKKERKGLDKLQLMNS